MAEAVVKEEGVEKYVDKIPRFVIPEGALDPPKAPEEAPKEPVVAETPEIPPTEDAPAQPPANRGELNRMHRAIRKAAEAQARTEAVERENAELRAKNAPPPPPTSEPRMEDFTDEGEYRTALKDHAKAEAIKEYQAQQQTQNSRQATEKLAKGWEAAVDRGSGKYDDFEEIVGRLQPTTPWAVAIMEAETGDEIAYYLGKNPKEQDRIFAMTPVSQIREIGKLEHRLSLKPEAPKQPSKAPAPISPVSGPGQVSNDELEPNMAYEKYMKVGNKMFRKG